MYRFLLVIAMKLIPLEINSFKPPDHETLHLGVLITEPAP